MAMAVQSGIGISRVLFLLATGHIGGSILLKDRKLSDLIGYIFFEKPKDQPKGETDEALAAEVRHLIDVVRNLPLTPSAPIIWNGGSEQSNLSSLVVPAAALGVVGYVYMWLKGLSFSSLMYVTRRNMENAVADLTKKLQHASDVIADAKKHLTERIQKLVDQIQEQIKMTRQIKADVSNVQDTVENIHADLSIVQRALAILNERMNTVIESQVRTNKALDYIINYIWANRVPDSLQGTIPKERPQLPCRSPGMITHPGITYPETPNLKSLKDFAESASDTIVPEPEDLDRLEQRRRQYWRGTPAKYLREGFNIATTINI